jgi:hypothetical protein
MKFEGLKISHRNFAPMLTESDAGIEAAIEAKSPTPRQASGLYRLVMPRDRIRDRLLVDLLLVGGRPRPSGDGQSRGSERRYHQRDQNGLKHGNSSSFGDSH